MPNCEIFSQISFCRSQQESDKVGRVGRLKAAFSNSVVTSKVDSQIGQGCSVPHHLREVFSIFRFRSSFFRFRRVWPAPWEIEPCFKIGQKIEKMHVFA